MLHNREPLLQNGLEGMRLKVVMSIKITQEEKDMQVVEAS